MKLKSPLKDKPLRNPGQSLDRRIIDVILDQQIKHLLIGLAIWTSLMSNWVYFFTEKPLPPFWFTLIALIIFAFCYYKIKKAMKKIDPLKQGRDGEKVVGQYLERLREKGVKVLHDIPGDGFNLDHVLVARSGVYVIETKTFSKPDKGEAKIIFTGDNLIHYNGFKDDKPLIQVKAAANWLKQQLKESTGRDVVVRKVLLFPGWYIEPTAEARQSDIWVLNPKALPAFISNSGEQLSGEDVAMMNYHLSRVVRVTSI